jgi:hypothetical protein
LATYGAEPGTVNKDTAKQLAAFEWRVLRRISVGMTANKNLRKWYKKELTQLLGEI